MVTFATSDIFSSLAKADGTVEIHLNGTLLVTHSVSSPTFGHLPLAPLRYDVSQIQFEFGDALKGVLREGQGGVSRFLSNFPPSI